MEDLKIFLKKLAGYAAGENEILLSYALSSLINTPQFCTTEWMEDLELILKQAQGNIKSVFVRNQVDECLIFVDDWFRKSLV